MESFSRNLWGREKTDETCELQEIYGKNRNMVWFETSFEILNVRSGKKQMVKPCGMDVDVDEGFICAARPAARDLPANMRKCCSRHIAEAFIVCK